MTDGDVLGRLLDTFVYAQLRAEMPFGRNSARAHHLRQDDGRREVDLVIETSGQRVIGIEVKATAAPTQHAARHLAWLREMIGDRFVAGVVLHTGPRFAATVQGMSLQARDGASRADLEDIAEVALRAWPG